MRVCILPLTLVCVLMQGLFAEERRLTDAEIEALLPTIIATNAASRQTFETTGHTTYVSGKTTYGTWEARGQQYCSNWGGTGPGSWACYKVFLDEDRGDAPMLIWVSETDQRFETWIEVRE